MFESAPYNANVPIYIHKINAPIVVYTLPQCNKRFREYNKIIYFPHSAQYESDTITIFVNTTCPYIDQYFPTLEIESRIVEEILNSARLSDIILLTVNKYLKDVQREIYNLNDPRNRIKSARK